jgi:selenocysteine lyase/cysteine desulfurase
MRRSRGICIWGEGLDLLEPSGHGYLPSPSLTADGTSISRTPSIRRTERTFARGAKRFDRRRRLPRGDWPRRVDSADREAARRVQAHILRLTDRLHDGLARAGARVITPREPIAARSGITTFTCGDPARDRTVVDRLLARRIFVSIRYTSGVGGIRASTHFFNDESDVDTLVENCRI